MTINPPAFRAVLFALWSLGATAVFAQAPASTTWDAPGFKDTRAHEGIESWERIDTLQGGLTLKFVDFTLPGDHGFALRLLRTFNSKGPARGWSFGLADLPMRIRNADAPWYTGPGPAVLPLLEMADGTQHAAGSWAIGPEVFKTADHWVYRRANGQREVLLPSGLVGRYVVLTTPSPTTGHQGVFLERIDGPYGPIARIHWADGTPSSPPSMLGIDHYVADAHGAVVGTDGFGQPQPHRTIEFYYPPGSTLPASAAVGGREWVYRWGAVVEALDPAEAAQAVSEQEPWRFTPTYAAGELTDLSVVTPQGGQITYRFGRQVIANDPETNAPIETEVIASRTVAPSANTAGGTWTYGFPIYGAGLTQVAGPGGVTRHYGYITAGGSPALKLDGGPVLALVATFQDGAEIGRETLWYEAAIDAGGKALVSTREIRRDNRSYTTAYAYASAAFGDFGQPSVIGETGDLTRTTTRSYDRRWWDTLGALPYLAPQLQTETVQVNQEQVVNSFAYADTGFMTRQVLAGIETNYGDDGDGDGRSRGNREIEWHAKTNGAEDRTVRVFAYGTEQDTQTPEGYWITRDVDPGTGLVTAETRGGATTRYAYDRLGRPLSITPPSSASAPSFPTWFGYSASAVTETRGDPAQPAAPPADYRQRVHTLNGFGRVVKTTDAKSVVLERSLDANGRDARVYLPRYASQANPTYTDVVYDALDRVRGETTRAGAATLGTRTFAYDNGDLRSTDEANRVTWQDRQAFGDPAEYRVASVTTVAVDRSPQPRGDITFRYDYNVAGKLTRVVAPDGSERRFVYGAARPTLLEREDHPESGSTAYLYDAWGRLETRTRPEVGAETIGYDRNGRLTSITRAGDPESVRFTYDERDNRRTARSGVAETTFTWDTSNRMVSRQDTVVGVAAMPAVTFTYNGFDNRTKISYPFGSWVDFTYDRANRLETARLNGQSQRLYDVTRFHASGAPEEIVFGNGMKEVVTFDPRQRVDTLKARFGTARTDLDLDYDYRPDGNIGRVADVYTPPGGATVTKTQTYTYDELNRLRTISGFSPMSYAYDDLGNRVGEGAMLLEYQGGRLWRRSAGAFTETFQYDLRGNTRADGQSSAPYTYTSRDMMASATIAGATTTFAYDSDQLRLSKTKNGVATLYVRGAAGEVLLEGELVNGVGTWKRSYVHAGSRLIASVAPAPAPPPPQNIGIALSFVGGSPVSEGAGQTTVRITLTTSDGQPVRTARTVSYQTADATAVAAGARPDYVARSGAVTLNVNDPAATVVDVPLTLVNDTINEPQESFWFGVSQPVPAWLVGVSQVSVAVNDDDPLTPVYLSLQTGAPSGELVVRESINPTAPAGLLVETANGAPTTHPVTVTIVTANGSVTAPPGLAVAVAGSDYAAVSLALVVPAGTPSGTLLAGAGAAVIDNAEQEIEETFSYALTGLVGASVKAATAARPRHDIATVRILDDDIIGISYTVPAVSVAENTGSHLVAVQVTTAYGGPTKTPVTLTVNTVPGTATAGADYTPLAGPVVIAAGTASGTVLQAPIAIFNDVMGEPTETFTLTLAAAGGAAYPYAQQVVSVTDTDNPAVRTQIDLTAASQTVAEAAGAVWISARVLTYDGQPVSALTPQWVDTLSAFPAAGWAQPNVDYQQLPLSYYPVAAGTPSGTVGTLALAIANDGLSEGPEVFQFRVQSSVPGAVGVGVQTVTIAAAAGARAGTASVHDAPSGPATDLTRAAPKPRDFGTWRFGGVVPATPVAPAFTQVP